MSKVPKKRYDQHKKCRCKYTKRFAGNVNMVYIEQLQHPIEKTLGSIAWHREKEVKHYSKKKKQEMINNNRIKTRAIMDSWHKKNDNHLRRDMHQEAWILD